MPFIKRTVTPVRLCQKPVPKEHQFDFEFVTNTSLVSVIQQLSCVAKQAEAIFEDLAQECSLVTGRANNLQERIQNINKHVDKLDAKSVIVPVSDLTTAAKTTDHYHNEPQILCQLFSPETRPDYVCEAYLAADPTPVHIISSTDPLRDDGLSGGKLFSPELVVSNNENWVAATTIQDLLHEPKVTPIPEIERKPKADFLPTDTHKSMPMLSELAENDLSDSEGEGTSEDVRMRELSRSQPITMVPIDTSGSSFKRMCSFRNSIRPVSQEYILEEGERSLSRKKKHSLRRQTVSGLPSLVFEELSTNFYNIKKSEILKLRSASKERWERPRSVIIEPTPIPVAQPEKVKQNSWSCLSNKSSKIRVKSLDNLDDPEEARLARSCSFRRSMKSLFKEKRSKSPVENLWAEGRPESPGPPTVDVNFSFPPLRRSRSLPRSLKSTLRDSSSRLSYSRSASTEGRLDAVDGEPEDQLYVEHIPRRQQRSHSFRIKRQKPGSKKSVTTLPRAQSNHGSLQRKSTGLFDRPKSMDYSEASDADLRQPIPTSSPVTPSAESLVISIQNRGDGVGPERHVHVNIPDKPWTKPFSKVKLRGAASKEIPQPQDRQSSSGHWSASSNSTRQSMDSEYPRSSQSSQEQHSIGTDKDSAVSLNIHNRSKPDRSRSKPSPVTEEMSSSGNESSVDVKANFTSMSTDEWLKTMKNKKGKGISETGTIRANELSGSDERNSPLSDLPLLTTLNLIAHDCSLAPMPSPGSRGGDDESSLYSVDQDGFYTSFHRDTGISRRRKGHIPEEDEMTLTSSCSTIHELEEGNTIKANKAKKGSTFMEKLSMGIRKTGSLKKKKKASPPPPPPRVSTILDKSNLTLDTVGKDEAMVDRESSELQRLQNLAGEMAARREKEMKSGESVVISGDSDTESLLYARVKVKTNISSAQAIPALCAITPSNSDEEDSDMLDYRSMWNTTNKPPYMTGSLKSTKSAPGVLAEDARPLSLVDHHHNSISSFGHENNNVASSVFTAAKTSAVVPERTLVSRLESESSAFSPPGYSTWPRPLPNPVKQDSSEGPSCMKKKEGKKKTKVIPPKTLTFAPKVNVFGSPEMTDMRRMIPDVKTPDGDLEFHGFGSPNHNTFRGSHEKLSKTPAGNLRAAEVCVTSTPMLPIKYQPSITVTAKTSSTSTSTSSTTLLHYNPTATWPRRKAASQINGKDFDSGTRDDSKIMTSTLNVCEDSTTKKMAAVSEYKGPKVHVVDCLPAPTVPKPPSSLELVAAPASIVKSKPYAAPAKLVISSPVAARASFVENPCKRSVCSPVTPDDLLKFWNYNNEENWFNTMPRKHALKSPTINQDAEIQEPPVSPDSGTLTKSKTMFDFPTPISTDPTKPPSQPFFPDIGSMKHSVSFPIERKEQSDASNHDRSWYDGVKLSNAKNKKDKTKKGPVPVQPPQAPRVSFTSFLRDQQQASSTVVVEAPFTFTGTVRRRRDSSISSGSTMSSGSAGKRASLLSSDQTSSCSSLNTASRSDTVSTSSTNSSSENNTGVPHDTNTIWENAMEGQVSPGGVKRSFGDAPRETLLDSSLDTTLENIESPVGDNDAKTTVTTPLVPTAQPEPNAKRQRVVISANKPSGGKSGPKRVDAEIPAPMITTSFVGPSNHTNIAGASRPTNEQQTNSGKNYILNKKSVQAPGKVNIQTSKSSEGPIIIAPNSKSSLPNARGEKKKGVTVNVQAKSDVKTSGKKPVMVATSFVGLSRQNTGSISFDDSSETGTVKKRPSPHRPSCAPPAPPSHVGAAGADDTSVSKDINTKSESQHPKPNQKKISTVQASSNVTGSLTRRTPGSHGTGVVAPKNVSTFTGYQPKQTNVVNKPVVGNIPVKNTEMPKPSAVSEKSNKIKQNTPTVTTSKSNVSTFTGPSQAKSIPVISTNATSSASKPPLARSSVFSGFQEMNKTRPAPPKFILPSAQRCPTKSPSTTTGRAEKENLPPGGGAGASGAFTPPKGVASTPEGAQPAGPYGNAGPGACVGEGRTKLRSSSSPMDSSQVVSILKAGNNGQSSDESKNQEPVIMRPRTKSSSSVHRLSLLFNGGTGSEGAGLSESTYSNLASSTGNLNSLSMSSSNLSSSRLSLTKSSDSLSSNSSATERSRMAKIAFLNGESTGDSPPPCKDSINDRFSKHYKKLSASRTSLYSSRTSLAELKEVSESGAQGNIDNHRSQIEPSSTHKPPSPGQGKFVSSVINQLKHKKQEPVVTSCKESSKIPNHTSV